MSTQTLLSSTCLINIHFILNGNRFVPYSVCIFYKLGHIYKYMCVCVHVTENCFANIQISK